MYSRTIKEFYNANSLVEPGIDPDAPITDICMEQSIPSSSNCSMVATREPHYQIENDLLSLCSTKASSFSVMYGGVKLMFQYNLNLETFENILQQIGERFASCQFVMPKITHLIVNSEETNDIITLNCLRVALSQNYTNLCCGFNFKPIELWCPSVEQIIEKLGTNWLC